MKKILLGVLLMFQALIAEEVYATFDVVSDKSSDLGLSVSGIVGTFYADIGQTLKQGDLILSLANAQEKQDVVAAKIALESAKKTAEHTGKIYSRYAAIPDVVDKEKMDKYRYDKEVAVLAYEGAQATLTLKEIAFKKTELRAPYDLVITQKYVEVGDLVTGSQSKLVGAMTPQDDKLILKFDEKYWQRVKAGQKFVYKVDGSTQSYEGQIVKVYPTILTKTREMQAEVKTKNLTPGLFGNGMIHVD